MKILRKRPLSFHKKYVFLIALVISAVVLFQLSNSKEGRLVIYLHNVIYYVSNYLIWALLIEYINGLAFPDQANSRIRSFVEIVIGTILLASIHSVVSNLVYYTFDVVTTDQTIDSALKEYYSLMFNSLPSRFLDLFIIVILLRILDTYKNLQDKKLEVALLEKDLHKTKLLALQSQLNPHFLFNSLHTLNTLIGYDDDKARGMVIKLTQLLRKILNHKETPLITFREELEYLQNYLEIEQERFNDRLTVSVNAPEETHDFIVPTLMLQPLVENAFKHGVSLVEGKALIELLAQMDEGNLHIWLKNTVPTEKQKSVIASNNIGLENLKQRLRELFDTNFDFSTEEENGWFTANLVIKKSE